MKNVAKIVIKLAFPRIYILSLQFSHLNISDKLSIELPSNRTVVKKFCNLFPNVACFV